MNIKTWQERLKESNHTGTELAFGVGPNKTSVTVLCMQAEIDELRAALKERDAELELIRVERNSLRVDIEFSRGTAEYWKAEHLAGNAVIAAQRKVLAQALEALSTLVPMYKEWHDEFPEHVGDKEATAIQLANAAITAIQGVLK